MKSNINSVEVHPKLSNNGHPVDGALVGAGSLWSSDPTLQYIPMDAWGEFTIIVSSNTYVYENFLSFKTTCVGILPNT